MQGIVGNVVHVVEETVVSFMLSPSCFDPARMSMISSQDVHDLQSSTGNERSSLKLLTERNVALAPLAGGSQYLCLELYWHQVVLQEMIMNMLTLVCNKQMFFFVWFYLNSDKGQRETLFGPRVNVVYRTSLQLWCRSHSCRRERGAGVL